jgi:hypothetical protein
MGAGLPNRSACVRALALAAVWPDDFASTAASGGIDAPSFAAARFQKLPRAFDGVALLVQQALDLQHQLHILAPVQPVSLAGLLRAERWKLSFPKPQYVRLDSRQTAHFTDPEVKLIGDLGPKIANHRLQHTWTFYQTIEPLSAAFLHWYLRNNVR